MRADTIVYLTTMVLYLLFVTVVGTTASRTKHQRHHPIGTPAGKGKKLPLPQPGTYPKGVPIRPARMQRAYKDGPEWAPAQFRVLVHCLQSSGCTYFMAILGQSAQVVTVLDVAINSDGVPARAQDVVVREDLYPSSSSPNSTTADKSRNPATIVVAKVPIWGLHEECPVERLRRLQRQFNPHATLLFVRHPVDNLASLNKHRLSKRTHHPGYALSHGDPHSKLQALEKLWKRREELFSEVVYYAELFLDRQNLIERLRLLHRRRREGAPSIDLPITHCNFCCLNAVRDLVADAKDRLRFRVAWGGGGISHLSPAGAYRKGSREKDLIDEVKGISPETLRGSDRSEKSLSKSKKTKRPGSSGSATLEEARGDDFVRACAEAERRKECTAQKRRLPRPSENKTKSPVAADFAENARLPVGMRPSQFLRQHSTPRRQKPIFKQEATTIMSAGGGDGRWSGKEEEEEEEEKKKKKRKRTSSFEVGSSERTRHFVGFVVVCGLLAYLARCGGGVGVGSNRRSQQPRSSSSSEDRDQRPRQAMRQTHRDRDAGAGGDSGGGGE